MNELWREIIITIRLMFNVLVIITGISCIMAAVKCSDTDYAGIIVSIGVFATVYGFNEVVRICKEIKL
ncbi:MAG: hypothetical protein IKS48_00385 [Eubacterium sp.]|nr:hypothetical protein [Eubacterium sp.]